MNDRELLELAARAAGGWIHVVRVLGNYGASSERWKRLG